jgi:hypothetical protein
MDRDIALKTNNLSKIFSRSEVVSAVYDWRQEQSDKRHKVWPDNEVTAISRLVTDVFIPAAKIVGRGVETVSLRDKEAEGLVSEILHGFGSDRQTALGNVALGIVRNLGRQCIAERSKLTRQSLRSVSIGEPQVQQHAMDPHYFEDDLGGFGIHPADQA